MNCLLVYCKIDFLKKFDVIPTLNSMYTVDR